VSEASFEETIQQSLPKGLQAMYFTEKQLRIMEFIQQFRAERGIAPTLEEIAKNFNVTKITIYEHINQLERKARSRERSSAPGRLRS